MIRSALTGALRRAGLFAMLTCLVGPARADWKDMNEAINQTNFIVDITDSSGAMVGLCSGTLISLKYKLILTNNHCVKDNIDKIEQEETDANGKVEKVTRETFRDMKLEQKSYKDFTEVGSTSLQAEIVAHDKKFDLAILRIKADSIPQTLYSQVLPPTQKVSRGDLVYVVGNPQGLDANLNEGHISSTTRKLHWDEDNTDVAYYGVDAGVNPGNSGGALYNADGLLIGVPAATIGHATALGFAIPVESIRKFLNENCYESVYAEGPDVKDHDACEKDKLDKENALRAKAGLPPKEAPKHDSLSGAAPAVHARSAVLRRPSGVGALLGLIGVTR
jgi:S1-C subfamily serine protease